MVRTPLHTPLVRSSTGGRRMYTAAAIVALLVVFAGFAPTYYPGALSALPISRPSSTCMAW